MQHSTLIGFKTNVIIAIFVSLRTSRVTRVRHDSWIHFSMRSGKQCSPPTAENVAV